MIKYDLVKRTAEFNYKNRKNIEEGCTALDPSPEYIKTFDDLEEAKKELAKRKTSVSKFENHNMTFYSVEEYVIEENEFEFDEDEGKLVQTGFIDTLETTSMEIEVVAMGFGRDQALADIDASLDSELEERKPLMEEEIPESLYDDILEGFRADKEMNA